MSHAISTRENSSDIILIYVNAKCVTVILESIQSPDSKNASHLPAQRSSISMHKSETQNQTDFKFER